jgi:epoxyqueuosine reductase
MTRTLSPAVLSERIRARALEMGFDAVGIAPLRPSDHGDAYSAWVREGRHGAMGYLAREDAVARRRDTSLSVADARSAVVVAKSYFVEDADPGAHRDPSRGIFARYARDLDYHDVLTPRLIELQDWISETLTPVGGRAYMDTGPVLERELAARAGIGWQARNTMLIRPEAGSYCFLGAVLLDIPLAYDRPYLEDRCGSCHRCVEACPTDALLGRDETGAPIMDARRCISYLTIELKGPIPGELRPQIGNRVYGCDICQEVCPWNADKFVQITDEPAFHAREGLDGPALIELMGLSQEDFSSRFRKSPVKRTKRRGLLRNVAVALGNWGSEEAVPVLVNAIEDAEPLVRGHAAWALGRIGGSDAVAALRERAEVEEDGWVREEIEVALGGDPRG